MMSNRKRRYSVTNIQQDFHKYILNDRGGNVAMVAVENKRVGQCSFFFAVLQIKRLRIQPSLLAPSRLGSFAKGLFSQAIDRCPLVKKTGGGNPSFPLNGYVPLIQGLIQFLESSTGYATILALHPQIGKLESPFNDKQQQKVIQVFPMIYKEPP